MIIEIFSRGAVQEVTGSRHYLKVGNSVFQIDCGAFQGRRAESLQKNLAIKDDNLTIDTVVLTHAHYDHSGMLPLLMKQGYTGNIFATPATEEVSELILQDSAGIQKRDIKYLKKQAALADEEFSGEVLYTEQDVQETMEKLLGLPYHRPLWLNDQVKLTFYDAGHILGSAAAVFDITVEGEENIRIAYSGDLGRKNTPIIRDPDKIPDPDYLILESTYGNRLHEPPENAGALLAKVITETTARGGKVVIPAFAVERTQEILYLMHLLQNEGKIPRIPIYVDSPMAVNATQIFSRHPECFDKETHAAFTNRDEDPFGFSNLIYTPGTEDSKRINSVKGPAVIIASSGMCEAGRIRHHLIRLIEDPANTILIVGYMAQHTLGRKILEHQSPVRIFNNWYEVRAEVRKINAFSAHADYQEITEHVGMLDLDRLKKIFLVHGEEPAQKHLREHLLAAGVKEVEIVEYDKRYRLSET
ncbi:MAG: MBL fold metallo-hydrolase [Bacteroidetes bacterium]|nr:MBL fold metallo-hydrolase [Bacteroidota bacterium]